MQPDAFDLVTREAARRGVSPEQLVEEIVRSDLAGIRAGDLDAALRRAAEVRSTMPRLDGVVERERLLLDCCYSVTGGRYCSR